MYSPTMNARFMEPPKYSGHPIVLWHPNHYECVRYELTEKGKRLSREHQDANRFLEMAARGEHYEIARYEHQRPILVGSDRVQAHIDSLFRKRTIIRN